MGDHGENPLQTLSFSFSVPSPPEHRGEPEGGCVSVVNVFSENPIFNF